MPQPSLDLIARITAVGALRADLAVRLLRGADAMRRLHGPYVTLLSQVEVDALSATVRALDSEIDLLCSSVEAVLELTGEGTA